MNRNGSSREIRLPAGLSPERIQRTIDGTAPRDIDREIDRGAGPPAAPRSQTQPRSSTRVNQADEANDVDNLSEKLENALRQRDEQSSRIVPAAGTALTGIENALRAADEQSGDEQFPDDAAEPVDVAAADSQADEATSDEPSRGPATAL